MVPRKKTYNLLVHQRAGAGSRAFLEGAGAGTAKKNYRMPELVNLFEGSRIRELVKKGTGSSTLDRIYDF